MVDFLNFVQCAFVIILLAFGVVGCPILFFHLRKKKQLLNGENVPNKYTIFQILCGIGFFFALFGAIYLLIKTSVSIPLLFIIFVAPILLIAIPIVLLILGIYFFKKGNKSLGITLIGFGIVIAILIVVLIILFSTGVIRIALM